MEAILDDKCRGLQRNGKCVKFNCKFLEFVKILKIPLAQRQLWDV